MKEKKLSRNKLKYKFLEAIKKKKKTELKCKC